jgi:hypothetical protein
VPAAGRGIAPLLGNSGGAEIHCENDGEHTRGVEPVDWRTMTQRN